MHKKFLILFFFLILFLPAGRTHNPRHSSSCYHEDLRQQNGITEFKYENRNEGILPFLKKAINKATARITKQETRRGSILDILIPVLSIVIVFLALMSFFIFLAVFIIKTRRLYKEKHRKKTGKVYLNLIADYLVNREQFEYPAFQKLYNPLNRSVLIDQIYDLSQNLFGSKQNKLLKLFRIRRLLRHVLFNIAISGKAKKALYLKLFSVIILNRHLFHKFYKYLFSKHNEIRRFAQLSILNYNTETLREILADYPFHLTLWDQIHFWEVIDRRATIPPDFYLYLNSNNPTVVVFGLRMIRIFYQKSQKEEQIIDLLSHQNEDIRYEALKTASDLNIEGVNKIMLAYLSEIDTKYKDLIIEYLIKSDMLDDNMLFDFFFNEKNEVDRLNILKTVYNNSPDGKRILEDLRNYTDEENIRSMCTYILENIT